MHQVYDAIAMHFNATRFAKWPKVAEFLEGLPKGSLVVDAGCGNGETGFFYENKFSICGLVSKYLLQVSFLGGVVIS